MILGFLSDIHEDIRSLEQALKVLEDERCETIVCLGDIVGFSLPFFQFIEERDANECVRLIKENCSLCVAGNHDLYAVKKTPNNNAGFEYGPDWYALPYETREKRARNKIWLYEDNELRCRLNTESFEYLADLPEVVSVPYDDGGIQCSHFCYPDYTGSTIFFPAEPFHLRNHFEQMKTANCTLGVSGHGHPAGILIAGPETLKVHKAGRHILDDQLNWIVVPCVARTTRPNGVAIYDTGLRELRAVPLSRNSMKKE